MTIKTLTVTKFYDHAQAQKDLRTYHPDLNIDFMRQPGLFSYYSTLLVKAESQYDRLENYLDLAEATVDRNIREEAATTKVKLTEAQIKSRVAADGKLLTMRMAVLEAKEEVGNLKATCEALRQRKDMLMQLGMLSREELKGGPSVMGNANRENRNERLRRFVGTDPFVEMSPIED